MQQNSKLQDEYTDDLCQRGIIEIFLLGSLEIRGGLLVVGCDLGSVSSM